MNCQYRFQFQPNFQRPFFNFSRTKYFNLKILISKTETGNFTVFSVIKTMFTIQIYKIVNKTQTFNFDNSFKKDIQIYPI